MNEYRIIPLNPQHQPLKINADFYDSNEKAFVFRNEDGDPVAIVNNDFIGAMRVVKLEQPVQSPGGTDEQPAGETEAAPG